jgi:predicted permease
LSETEAEARGAVIVNEAFARRYWPGQNALGKRIQMGGGEGTNDAPSLTVVGVTKDGKYNSLGEEATPFFYRAATQVYVSSPTLLVRTQGNPAEALATVRSAVESLDKNLPLYDVKTMRQHLGLALLPARLAGSALGIFGLLALLLAAAGLYGVMANVVAGRTREIGIRMALGADALAVLRLILQQGMQLVLIGLSLGLAAALAVTHLLKSLLFGVSATDPLTFVGIGLLLTAVALLACWIPARRATRVDPMIALHTD